MAGILRVLIRYWPTVLGVVALAAFGGLWFLWQSAQEDAHIAAERAHRAEQDLQITRDQVDRIRANAATSALIAEQMNRGVNEALTQNADWGAQRTPDAVVVELCKHLRCTEQGSPVRTPTGAGTD